MSSERSECSRNVERYSKVRNDLQLVETYVKAFSVPKRLKNFKPDFPKFVVMRSTTNNFSDN